MTQGKISDKTDNTNDTNKHGEKNSPKMIALMNMELLVIQFFYHPKKIL